MKDQKNSQNRLVLSVALICAALIASFAMSLAANQKEKYWVVTHPISEGARIESADIQLTSVYLGSLKGSYIPAQINPIGYVARNNLQSGQLLSRNQLAKNDRDLQLEELSLSIRAVDMPEELQVGDEVSIYQLHDAKNGENPHELSHVLDRVFISAINRKSDNFGSQVAISVLIDSSDVETLLASTTSGRLALVGYRE